MSVLKVSIYGYCYTMHGWRDVTQRKEWTGEFQGNDGIYKGLDWMCRVGMSGSDCCWRDRVHRNSGNTIVPGVMKCSYLE